MPDQISDNSDSVPIPDPVPNEPWFAKGQTFLERIADHSERQREKDAPTIIDLTNSKNTIATHTRLRVIDFIFTPSVNSHVSVAIGGRVFDFWVLLGVTVVPFPIEIDRGIDITFTNVTNPLTVTYFYLVAYTE